MLIFVVAAVHGGLELLSDVVYPFADFVYGFKMFLDSGLAAFRFFFRVLKIFCESTDVY